MSNFLQKGWSIDPETLSKVSDDIFKGSWDTFRVTQANTERVPVKPGIYIFSASISSRASNDLFKSFKTPIYIGISEVNIRDRYRSHFKNPLFLPARKSFDPYFEFSCKAVDEEEVKYLRQWEDELIRMFGPAINSINSITKSPVTSRDNNET
tara:strand:+ start:379 stop:837 length:459 start_codon:yes stop_codon:yes gene_type:complete